MEPTHVTLSGDLSGDYVVEDRRPDGRVVLRPDLSVKAMLARHGERELTPEEFEQHFGDLPTDGEASPPLASSAAKTKDATAPSCPTA